MPLPPQEHVQHLLCNDSNNQKLNSQACNCCCCANIWFWCPGFRWDKAWALGWPPPDTPGGAPPCIIPVIMGPAWLTCGTPGPATPACICWPIVTPGCCPPPGTPWLDGCPWAIGWPPWATPAWPAMPAGCVAKGWLILAIMVGTSLAANAHESQNRAVWSTRGSFGRITPRLGSDRPWEALAIGRRWGRSLVQQSPHSEVAVPWFLRAYTVCVMITQYFFELPWSLWRAQCASLTSRTMRKLRISAVRSRGESQWDHSLAVSVPYVFLGSLVWLNVQL